MVWRSVGENVDGGFLLAWLCRMTSRRAKDGPQVVLGLGVLVGMGYTVSMRRSNPMHGRDLKRP